MINQTPKRISSIMFKPKEVKDRSKTRKIHANFQITCQNNTFFTCLRPNSLMDQVNKRVITEKLHVFRFPQVKVRHSYKRQYKNKEEDK